MHNEEMLCFSVIIVCFYQIQQFKNVHLLTFNKNRVKTTPANRCNLLKCNFTKMVKSDLAVAGVYNPESMISPRLMDF